MSEPYSNASSLRTVWSFVLIVIVSLLCFYPTLNNGLLIWDDSGYILENVNIRSLSVDTLQWAFTTFYVNYWAPLTWISFAIDYAFWGLNPVGYHLTNNVIHALNAGLFFLLALYLLRSHSLTKRKHPVDAITLTANAEFYCAVLAAFLFSLHPLRVQSVAWATERKDVLCVFFGILSLIFYIHHAMSAINKDDHTERVNVFLPSQYYWLTVLFYCLSLLSKSMLVVLPAVLLVLDWFPLRRYSRKTIGELLFEKVSFVLLAGLASILTIRSQGESLMSFEQTNFVTRFFLACKSIMLYLWMTIWPLDISPFYVHPGRSLSAIGLDHIVSLVFCLTITVLCLLTMRKRPVFTAVWLIYVITLSPVLGFTQTGPEGMAARFTYFPGMAFALIISFGITVLISQFRTSQPIVALSMFIVISLPLMYWTITRTDISYWKNDISLWTRVIDLKPHSTGRAYYERSYAYLLNKQYAAALDDINEALSIAVNKNYNRIYDIQVQRARILKQMGNFEEAIAAYTDAINLDHSQNRQMYFAERGKVYSLMGKSNLAEADFNQAGMR